MIIMFDFKLVLILRLGFVIAKGTYCMSLVILQCFMFFMGDLTVSHVGFMVFYDISFLTPSII